MLFFFSDISSRVDGVLHLLLLGDGGEILLDLDVGVPPVLLGELRGGGLLAILHGSGRWEESLCIFLIFLTFSFQGLMVSCISYSMARWIVAVCLMVLELVEDMVMEDLMAAPSYSCC